MTCKTCRYQSSCTRLEIIDDKCDKYKPAPEPQKILWEPIPDPMPYGTEDQLNKTIIDYIKTQLELNSDEDYATFAAWIKQTWIIEKFEVTAYLEFLGPIESGKTRALEVLKQLCYKAIHTGNLSRAFIFHTCDKNHPVLLLDQAESYTGKDEEAQEMQRLLNAGYRRGALVGRMEKDSKGNQVERLYDPFGPKALAGENILGLALESRCIVFKMFANTRPMKINLDKTQAYQIRAMLNQWRIDHLDIVDNQLQAIYEEETISSISSNRLRELYIPLLLSICPAGEHQEYQVYQQVLNRAKESQHVWDEATRASLDAEVLEACRSTYKFEGRFTARSVVNIMNDGIVNEQEQYRARSIGFRIAKLGFMRTHMQKDGAPGWLWDENIYTRRARQLKTKTDPQLTLEAMGSVEPKPFAAKSYAMGTCLVLPPSHFSPGDS